MKNKGLTFVLLLVVGVIWFKVFFRIKDNLSNEDTSVQVQGELGLPRKNYVKDTFALQANYRDPFHSNSPSSSTSPSNDANGNGPQPAPVQQIIKPQPEPPKPHRWPKMRYFGLMKSNPQKGTLAILTIDNMRFNLREGEEAYDGIYVRKIYGDSVLMVHEKYGRVLKK